MSDEFSIHPAARDEFHEAIRHYAALDDGDQDNEPLAFAFESAFNRQIDDILANPLLFNLRRPPSRRANLTPRFGEYYIAYMIWRNKVVILAVAHARRRPYYWRKRIGEAKRLF